MSHSAAGPTQEKKDFMLKVAMHNIMKLCHAHESEDFASSCLLSVQGETIGNCGESDLSSDMF